MENVLVTGGLSYLGINVVEALEDSGYGVIIYDNSTDENKQLTKNRTFIEGDVQNVGLIVDSIDRYKVTSVIHIAVSKDEININLDPLKYWNNNILGLVSILRAMSQRYITSFVCTSDSFVYGKVDSMIDNINENTPLMSTGALGNIFKAMEDIIKDYKIVHDNFNAVILRIFNIGGAGYRGWGKYSSGRLIPYVLHNIYKENTVKVYGSSYETYDGTVVRDIVHVSDVADAYVKALKYTMNGQTNTFNVGSGVSSSFKDIISSLELVTSKGAEVKYYNNRDEVPPSLVANINFIKRELNWTPKYNYKNIIDSSYKWYVDNFL